MWIQDWNANTCQTSSGVIGEGKSSCWRAGKRSTKDEVYITSGTESLIALGGGVGEADGTCMCG